MVAGVRQKTEKDVMNTDTLKKIHRSDVKNLLPGQTYRVWVRYNNKYMIFHSPNTLLI
jgi:hypothetical protein